MQKSVSMWDSNPRSGLIKALCQLSYREHLWGKKTWKIQKNFHSILLAASKRLKLDVAKFHEGGSASLKEIILEGDAKPRVFGLREEANLVMVQPSLTSLSYRTRRNNECLVMYHFNILYIPKKLSGRTCPRLCYLFFRGFRSIMIHLFIERQKIKLWDFSERKDIKKKNFWPCFAADYRNSNFGLWRICAKHFSDFKSCVVGRRYSPSLVIGDE